MNRTFATMIAIGVLAVIAFVVVGMLFFVDSPDPEVEVRSTAVSSSTETIEVLVSVEGLGAFKELGAQGISFRNLPVNGKMEFLVNNGILTEYHVVRTCNLRVFVDEGRRRRETYERVFVIPNEDFFATYGFEGQILYHFPVGNRYIILDLSHLQKRSEWELISSHHQEVITAEIMEG